MGFETSIVRLQSCSSPNCPFGHKGVGTFCKLSPPCYNMRISVTIDHCADENIIKFLISFLRRIKVFYKKWCSTKLIALISRIRRAIVQPKRNLKWPRMPLKWKLMGKNFVRPVENFFFSSASSLFFKINSFACTFRPTLPFGHKGVAKVVLLLLVFYYTYFSLNKFSF